MWISSYEVTRFFLYSLIFGVFAGAFYDVFRILRIARKPKGESLSKHSLLRLGDTFLCFADDLIYWMVLAVVYSIFIYHQIDGRFRPGSLLAAAGGFLLWHFTVGRLIVFLADRIIGLVRRVITFVISVTLIPIVRVICFIGKKVRILFGSVFGSIYHSIAVRRELSLASKGFKLNKRSKK